MKYLIKVSLFFLSLLGLSCSESNIDVKLTSIDDSLSYYQGVFAGWKLRENGYRAIDYSKFKEGFELAKAESKLNFEKRMDASLIINQKFEAKINNFFAKNKDKKGVITTPSGLQYEVIEYGDKNGVMPVLGDSVKLSLKGYRIDGVQFQSYKGVMVFIGRIPGFREGISKMKKGSKYKFYFPPHLGIGNDMELTAPSMYRNMPSIYEVEIFEIYPVK